MPLTGFRREQIECFDPIGRPLHLAVATKRHEPVRSPTRPPKYIQHPSNQATGPRALQLECVLLHYSSASSGTLMHPDILNPLAG